MPLSEATTLSHRFDYLSYTLAQQKTFVKPFAKKLFCLVDFVEVCPECRKGLIADDVFNAARIVGSRLARNTEAHKALGQHGVALIDFLGHGVTAFGQRYEAVSVDSDEAALFEQADGTADTRLGKAHRLTYINTSDVAALL